MKITIKEISFIFACIGFIGLIVLSLMAIIDSQAQDMASGIMVQILFGSMFIAGFISYSLQEKEKVD